MKQKKKDCQTKIEPKYFEKNEIKREERQRVSNGRAWRKL